MKVIADSSPLISFAILNRLELLMQLYTEIRIPQAVFDEISQPGKPHAQALHLFAHNKVALVKNQMAVNMLLTDVDRGEAEAIVLALESGIVDLLIDDAKGRRAAQLKGLQVTGTIGVLLAAKKRQLIAHLRPELDSLIANRIRIGQMLYDQALQLAGEK
ncbi:MAG: DUF3368 domain-containing protein [Caldilineaceae bacterium]